MVIGWYYTFKHSTQSQGIFQLKGSDYVDTAVTNLVDNPRFKYTK